MRRIITVILICLMFYVAGSAGAEDKKGWLIKDGEACGYLFLPERPGRAVQFAAEELRSYLEKMTGVRLPVSWRDPERRDTGFRFSVRGEEEWRGEESAQAFVIEEDDSFIEIRGNTETAVLYGVYQYLHEQGVRWYTPGVHGESVPEAAGIAIGSRKQHYSPTFIERVMDLSGTATTHFGPPDYSREQYRAINDYSLWYLRNRLHFFRTIHRRNRFDFNRLYTMGSGHGLRLFVLGDADIEEEPERFPKLWREGELVRTDTGPRQICFTSEKNIQVAAEFAISELKEKKATRDERCSDLDEVMAVGMGLADCRGICKCPDCEEAGGEPPFNQDRLVWGFFNHVIEKVNEEVPDGSIWIYAPYMELDRPPEDIEIDPNLSAYSARTTTWSLRPEDKPYYPFTRQYSENIRATANAGVEMRARDYVLWPLQGATPQPLNIFDAAEEYKDIGYRHYHVEVMQRSAQLWPVLWVLAHYTWDSTQDPDALLENYCYGSYGEAGGEVVLELLREMDANSRRVHRIAFGNTYDTSMMLPDDLIGRGLQELEDVLEAASGGEKERLEEFRDMFEMYGRQARVFRAYCEALNKRTEATKSEAKELLERFVEFWEDRNMGASSSPRILSANKTTMEAVEEIEGAEPAARDGMEDEETRFGELYAEGDAGPQPPDQKPDNFFELPEIWMFRVDYEDVGLEQGWPEPDYEVGTGWQPLSTWNFFGRQGYTNVHGRYWYRLEFKAPHFPDDEEVMMRIGSLDDEGEIYINGEFVYEQDNPDDWNRSFAFDVTPYLKQGEKNVIAVRGYDAVGAGGLWRPSALYTK